MQRWQLEFDQTPFFMPAANRAVCSLQQPGTAAAILVFTVDSVSRRGLKDGYYWRAPPPDCASFVCLDFSGRPAVYFCATSSMSLLAIQVERTLVI